MEKGKARSLIENNTFATVQLCHAKVVGYQVARLQLRPKSLRRHGGEKYLRVRRDASVYPADRQVGGLYPHRGEGGGTPAEKIRPNQVWVSPTHHRLS